MSALKKRLLALYAIGDKDHPGWDVLKKAADRIEELEEERYALIHQNCKDAHRIAELEAKLKRQNEIYHRQRDTMAELERELEGKSCMTTCSVCGSESAKSSELLANKRIAKLEKKLNRQQWWTNNMEGTAIVLSSALDTERKKTEALEADVKELETILAEFEDLGKQYEKRINKYYFYKESRIYTTGQNSMEAGGGSTDSK